MLCTRMDAQPLAAVPSYSGDGPAQERGCAGAELGTTVSPWRAYRTVWHRSPVRRLDKAVALFKWLTIPPHQARGKHAWDDDSTGAIQQLWVP
jgi:hypothetical protein